MKKLFSSFTTRFKTQRRRAAMDCRDFIAERPEAPPSAELRALIAQRLFPAETTPPPASAAENESREQQVRSSFFDLRYRCGAAGRCIGSSIGCRFPCCFQLRPLTKGAEIFAERMAYESLSTDGADPGDAAAAAALPSADIVALVELAREDQLEACVEGIKQLVAQKLVAACGARRLSSKFEAPETGLRLPDRDRRPAYGADGAHEGVNPLETEGQLRDEVLALYLWRAALLVTLRRDEPAVFSLLNLAQATPLPDRARLYAAAAKWAMLNDREIAFYRGLAQDSDADFEPARSMDRGRETLLRAVFEAVASDADSARLTDLCTQVVFGQEITAIVSGAQAARLNGDAAEDPLSSLTLPFAARYYRWHVGPHFWRSFFNLLALPPMPSELPGRFTPTAGFSAATANAPTPPNVLDAMARSMMLHHMLLMHKERERDIADGTTKKELDKFLAFHNEMNARVPPNERRPADLSAFDRVFDDNEAQVAGGRLQQLLQLVREYERTGQARVPGQAEAEQLGAAREAAAGDAPTGPKKE